jgi:nucleoid-associated protein YgaU
VRGRARRVAIVALAAASAAQLGAAAARAERVHVVQPGESLWRIAADRLGNPREWLWLYRANRDQIKDPALLYPGQELAIPEPPGRQVRSPQERPAN